MWVKGSSGKVMEGGDCELEAFGGHSWLPVTMMTMMLIVRVFGGRWQQLRHSPGDPVTADMQLRDKHKPQCRDGYEIDRSKMAEMN